MGAVEMAEQKFTSSIGDLEDACIGFLAVATPEPGESAQEHLEAVHAALDDVLSMAVRLNCRVTELRESEHYRAA
jgi:hypothetical protein